VLARRSLSAANGREEGVGESMRARFIVPCVAAALVAVLRNAYIEKLGADMDRQREIMVTTAYNQKVRTLRLSRMRWRRPQSVRRLLPPYAGLSATPVITRPRRRPPMALLLILPGAW